MPVAGDDLARHLLDAEAQFGAHVLLDVRVDQRVRADGAGDRADRDLRAGGLQPPYTAVGGEGEAGEFVAERRGFRVHAVGAADAGGVPVLDGPVHQDAAQPGHRGEQYVAGAGEGVAEGRVHQVVARHTEVHPAGGVVGDVLAVGGEEGQDLVVALALDLGHPGGGRYPGLPDVRERARGDPAEPGLRLGRQDLHLRPGGVPGLVGPEFRHLGQRITGNHHRSPFAGILASRRILIQVAGYGSLMP